jgi:hypothetical protein
LIKVILISAPLLRLPNTDALIIGVFGIEICPEDTLKLTALASFALIIILSSFKAFSFVLEKICSLLLLIQPSAPVSVTESHFTLPYNFTDAFAPCRKSPSRLAEIISCCCGGFGNVKITPVIAPPATIVPMDEHKIMILCLLCFTISSLFLLNISNGHIFLLKI